MTFFLVGHFDIFFFKKTFFLLHLNENHMRYHLFLHSSNIVCESLDFQSIYKIKMPFFETDKHCLTHF